jgi:hypothetical protein
VVAAAEMMIMAMAVCLEMIQGRGLPLVVMAVAAEAV